jgi:hypothetical protein
MWMNPLLEDTLARDRLARAQEQAARRRLLRSAKPARARRRSWAATLHLVPVTVVLRLKRRIERMAFQ